MISVRFSAFFTSLALPAGAFLDTVCLMTPPLTYTCICLLLCAGERHEGLDAGRLAVFRLVAGMVFLATEGSTPDGANVRVFKIGV